MREAWCDWDRLRDCVSASYLGGADSIHGPRHWRRVEEFGIDLAGQNGANVLVVRLFAWFHDAERVNEDIDPGHGQRGAELARKFRGEFFGLSGDDFERLVDACARHTDGELSMDPTVGACWDADRLDLGRVGIVPDPSLLWETPRLCRGGSSSLTFPGIWSPMFLVSDMSWCTK